MSYPTAKIQEAIVLALKSDSALLAMIDEVYDQPPADAAFPFVSIEQIDSSDWSFKGAAGIEARFEIACYSRYHGKSECYAIIERIEGLLHEASLFISGVTIAQSRMVSSRVSMLRDGRTVRGQLQFILFAH